MYKVLVVDDEILVVKSLIASIEWEEYGYEVIGHAESCDDAFENIKSLKPDLVITDIRMPGRNGIDLLKMVRDCQLDTQFIVISGYADFTYAQKAMLYGAAGYCLKPFDEKEIAGLLIRVRSSLEKYREAMKTFEQPSKDNDSCDNGIRPDYSPGNSKNNLFNEIIRYINNNFDSDLNLGSISEKFIINPNYLSQVFKKETGYTFTDYITRLRISKACELLKSTQLTTREVAEKSGYNDYFYFCRTFKKSIGKTPRQFRENPQAQPSPGTR